MFILTFKLVERKKALARYDEQPDENGAYANGSPKPLLGVLWPRMDILGTPESFTLTITPKE